MFFLGHGVYTTQKANNTKYTKTQTTLVQSPHDTWPGNHAPEPTQESLNIMGGQTKRETTLTRKCFFTNFTLLGAVVEMSSNVFNVGSL